MDTETGMYYLMSRYYDPVTHRFLNADSQLNLNSGMTGVNLFGYCGNNPINRNDPTGHDWWHWAIGAAIVAACAVATVVTCGGFAAATTASTIAAGAFIGSATVYGMSVVSAAATSRSTSEFCSKGNWGTVAATAGGAVFGGAGAYIGTRGSSYSNSSSYQSPYTYKSKIVSNVSNDVIGLQRTGSALKTDRYHAFPNIVDNYAGYATKSSINNNATLYQLQGSLNGVVGRFEWIIQNQKVTHRMFVPGGEINGIPIMP